MYSYEHALTLIRVSISPSLPFLASSFWHFTFGKDFRDRLVPMWCVDFSNGILGVWFYMQTRLYEIDLFSIIDYSLFFLYLAQDPHFKLPLFWQSIHIHLHPWLLKSHRFVPDLLASTESKTGSTTRMIPCTCLATRNRETSVMDHCPGPRPDFSSQQSWNTYNSGQGVSFSSIFAQMDPRSEAMKFGKCIVTQNR